MTNKRGLVAAGKLSSWRLFFFFQRLWMSHYMSLNSKSGQFTMIPFKPLSNKQ